jgi:hypothetical protein
MHPRAGTGPRPEKSSGAAKRAKVVSFHTTKTHSGHRLGQNPALQRTSNSMLHNPLCCPPSCPPLSLMRASDEAARIRHCCRFCRADLAVYRCLRSSPQEFPVSAFYRLAIRRRATRFGRPKGLKQDSMSLAGSPAKPS